jgi:hypothetical protein
MVHEEEYLVPVMPQPDPVELVGQERDKAYNGNLTGSLYLFSSPFKGRVFLLGANAEKK